jgi:hypothetical protein
MPSQAWHGNRITIAHHEEVGVNAYEHVCASPLRSRRRCAAGGHLLPNLMTQIPLRLNITMEASMVFDVGYYYFFDPNSVQIAGYWRKKPAAE